MFFPLGVTLYHIIHLLLDEDIFLKPHPLFRKRGGFLISEFSCPTLSLASYLFSIFIAIKCKLENGVNRMLWKDFSFWKFPFGVKPSLWRFFFCFFFLLINAYDSQVWLSDLHFDSPFYLGIWFSFFNFFFSLKFIYSFIILWFTRFLFTLTMIALTSWSRMK